MEQIKKRGFLLTLAIILIVLGAVMTPFRELAQNQAVRQLSENASSSGMWFGMRPDGTFGTVTVSQIAQTDTISSTNLVSDILYGILLVICGIAMFRWKKWGVYGYFIVSFLVFIIYSVLLPAKYLTLLNVTDFFVTLAIVFWIIHRKWHFFE